MSLEPGQILAKRYKLKSPLGAGGAFLAVDQENYRDCVVEELADTPRLRLLGHLDHDGLPRFIEFLPAPGANGERRILVREHVEGKTLAERLAEAPPLTELELLDLARQAAKVLLYLHGHSPRVLHGRIRPANILLGTGGKLRLLGLGEPSVPGEPSEAGDLRALGLALAAAAAKSADGEKSSPRLRELLARLSGARDGKPIGSAAELGAELRLLSGAPPPALAQSRPKERRIRWHSMPLALLVLGSSFYLGVKLRFDWLPRYGASRGAHRGGGTREIYREFGCGKAHPPRPIVGQNILLNPDLEGPCGWDSYAALERRFISDRDSASGRYHFVLEEEGDGLYQQLNVDPLSREIDSGAYYLTARGRFRSNGGGPTGNPYLYVYAMSDDSNIIEHLTGFAPVQAAEWTTASKTWRLPILTRRLVLHLGRNSHQGVRDHNAAHFDALELIAHPDPGNPALTRPLLGHELRGSLSYEGKRLDRLTRQQPSFWFRDERAGKAHLAETDYDEGSFHFRGFPPGDYGVSVHVDANLVNPAGYPGDFYAWQTFKVTEDRKDWDIPLLRILRLRQPQDNDEKMPGWDEPCESKPSFRSPVAFYWKPLGQGTSYHYRVERVGCPHSGASELDRGQLTGDKLDVSLPQSAPGEMYVFHLEAWKDGKKIGLLMTHGKNGEGWDYRFRVR